MICPCHTKIGPHQSVPPQNWSPRTDFGKKIIKNGPPGPILAAKSGPPLPKIVPQGGPNLANICLPKLVPQAKLRVYTQRMHVH